MTSYSTLQTFGNQKYGFVTEGSMPAYAALWVGDGVPGGGSSAPISSVNANGFFGVYNGSRPSSFDPNGDPESFDVTSPAFTADGTATTTSRSIILTKPVREMYPNHATLTADLAAFSEYVYSGDTGNFTNNSTVSYPKVIARWASMPRESFTGAMYLEVVGFQKFGRDKLPLRGVKITGTPATGSAVTVQCVYAKSGYYGDNLPVWRAQFSPSDFPSNAGGDVTFTFESYGWIGDANSKRPTAGR